jgi:D-alanyl-D-alanine carboxypeptidase/D-alanyl-D-alanine-endopeptidase (penicillin-binding protein 4)
VASGAGPSVRPRPTPRPSRGATRQAPPDARPGATPAGRGAAREVTAPVRSRRRGLRILVALCLAAALVVGGVAVAIQLTGVGSGTEPAADRLPDPVLPTLGAAPPVLAGLDSQAPQPTALAPVLDPLLAAPALGAGVSAVVVDVDSGGVLFDRDAADPGTPASTAKLLTSVAALTELDPSDRISTTVVAGAVPGEVVLVGGGDPTLSRTTPSQSYPGAATVQDLAGQVSAALAGVAVTRVVVDTSLYSGPAIAPGWGPDDAPSTYAAPITAVAVDGGRTRAGSLARSAQPALDAGKALAEALGAPGATVAQGQAPAGAPVLGQVSSAPIARLVEQTLAMSDNVLAEALARQVAVSRGLPASFAGGAEAVPAALTDAGFDVSGVVLDDGSGLSVLDRVPAALLAELIRDVADGSIPTASTLLSGLPVAGYDGTLADRGDADGDAAPGSVRAKTGTLLGVSGLAGTVVTTDGRLLAFAVLADGVPGDVDSAEAALDEVAAALADCGCR